MDLAIGKFTALPAETALPAAVPAASSAVLKKKATEFESILIGQWLDKMQETAGSDGGEEEKSGLEGYRDFTKQAIAGVVAETGKLGLANQILAHLPKADTEPLK